MVIKIIATIILSVLCGFLYRLGGYGDPFNTKIRDFGCPLISIATLLVWGFYPSWWLYLFYFGLSFGAMTTYNKWASKLIGKDDNSVHWISWLVTGLSYGVAVLPIVWGNWVGFSIRCVILAGLTVAWSEAIDKDWVEEGGRGVWFNATIPLLLIGG